MLPVILRGRDRFNRSFELEDLNALFFENNVFNHALEGHNVNRKQQIIVRRAPEVRYNLLNLVAIN